MIDRPRQPGDPASLAQRAFTLIELVAVIVILSIVAATAAPVLTHTSASARTAGATHVARDIAYARERSLATGTATWVVFDDDLRGYSLLVEDPDAPGLAGATILADPAGRADYSVDLDTSEFAGISIQSVEIAIAGSALGFDWLGRPKYADGALLTTDAAVAIQNGPTITIHAGTGLVTLSTASP